jgi:hypothetical protein
VFSLHISDISSQILDSSLPLHWASAAALNSARWWIKLLTVGKTWLLPRASESLAIPEKHCVEKNYVYFGIPEVALKCERTNRSSMFNGKRTTHEK